MLTDKKHIVHWHKQYFVSQSKVHITLQIRNVWLRLIFQSLKTWSACKNILSLCYNNNWSVFNSMNFEWNWDFNQGIKTKTGTSEEGLSAYITPVNQWISL